MQIVLKTISLLLTTECIKVLNVYSMLVETTTVNIYGKSLLSIQVLLIIGEHCA